MAVPDPLVQLVQVVYLTRHDFDIYRDSRLLPTTGAFIESARVPLSRDAATLWAWAEERLRHNEGYRSSYWNTPPRQFRIDSIHEGAPLFATLCARPFASVRHLDAKDAKDATKLCVVVDWSA